VEQNTENMKTGVIGGAEHQFLCFRYSAPPMAPVFVFSVLCSTDGTNFHVIKSGVISGAEYRKHENWCHQWSRVPKT
jgi:hypothetical protein